MEIMHIFNYFFLPNQSVEASSSEERLSSAVVVIEAELRSPAPAVLVVLLPHDDVMTETDEAVAIEEALAVAAAAAATTADVDEDADADDDIGDDVWGGDPVT